MSSILSLMRKHRTLWWFDENGPHCVIGRVSISRCGLDEIDVTLLEKVCP